LSSGLEIRDPIHGFIHRDPHELKVIDTFLFQRLRRIKQLALACYVYPGALHTRFEHSMGAMHVAGRVATELQLKPHECRILRLAALLHDIGHGPFSHGSEEVIWGVTGNKQAHEEITAQIILKSPELDDPLSGDERKEIVGLLKDERGDALMRSILSGPLDVDKQDYLLRDSYFCGVKYGVYDIDRLIETLCICEDRGQRELAITEDGIHTLEQFVIARYHMTVQVYRHRIRLITDSMIVRGIELGIQKDGLSWLKELYAYDGSEAFIRNYLDWDDDKMVRRILGGGDVKGYAHRMFDRLVNRRLFKRVLRVNFNDIDPPGRRLLLQEDPGKMREVQKEVECEVAKHLTGVDESLVIARIVKQKSAAKTEAAILVVRTDGAPREFRQESTLFNSIDAAIQEQYLDVYAPVSWADIHDKKEKLASYRREILPAVNEMLKAKSLSIREAAGGIASGGGTVDGDR
jgi:hypothetical protein